MALTLSPFPPAPLPPPFALPLGTASINRPARCFLLLLRLCRPSLLSAAEGEEEASVPSAATVVVASISVVEEEAEEGDAEVREPEQLPAAPPPRRRPRRPAARLHLRSTSAQDLRIRRVLLMALAASARKSLLIRQYTKTPRQAFRVIKNWELDGGGK